jgi:transcription elongation GreA/GreB family factor
LKRQKHGLENYCVKRTEDPMMYVFSREGHAEFVKVLEAAERSWQEASKAKAEAGGEQDAWHEEGFKMGIGEEFTWERRVSQLRGIAADATVRDPEEQSEKIKFGVGFEIVYLDTQERRRFIMDGYMVSGSLQNRVSVYSPLAEALLKAREGDVRFFSMDGKKRPIQIVKIVPPSQAKAFIEQ